MMKSYASLKGHPLHAILVVFPLAFFSGTLLFDLVALFTGNSGWVRSAPYLNLAGVLGAVLAAIPGILDYIFTVPPKSSAAKRATKHGLINTAVLALFLGLLIYRQSERPLVAVIIGLETFGVLLLLIAGWLGGTLVHRNQIGVDIRYAHAGKWKEERLTGQGKRVRVASANELLLDQMKLIHLDGQRIVIGRSEHGFVAFEDHCTHRGGSLAAGTMICGTVQCPWHGSQFDCHTGAVKAGPAKEAIRTFPIQEEQGMVYLIVRE